jgi:hypothetical protein
MDVPSFEQATIEADMKTLAAEIRKNREQPELKNASEKELLKEAIRTFPSLGERQPSAAVPAPAVPANSAAQSPLPAYAQNAPAEVKLEIEYLLDIAFRQGIGKALDESKKSPYFVQDAFHDALAGKLYPELQKKGIVP